MAKLTKMQVTKKTPAQKLGRPMPKPAKPPMKPGAKSGCK